MLDLQNLYTWRAIYPDGTEQTIGEDIAGAALISLIPAIPALLPQHDIVGLPFVKRFSRGFLRGTGGGLREYIHCIITKECRIYVKSTTGAILVSPVEYELYL